MNVRLFSSLVVLIAPITVLASCSSESGLVPTSVDGSAPLAAKTPTPPPIDVTARFNDADASGSLLLTRSDDYNGSGFATYVTNTSRQGGYTSRLTSSGGWQLLLGGQTTRTLYLVLASQGMSGIPDGNYSAKIEAFVRCFDQTNTRVSLSDMASGASNGNCTFGLDFAVGRTGYKLALGPDFDSASPTGRAMVTCTAVSGGSCTSWVVVPNPSTLTTFTLANGQVVSAPAANLYLGTTGATFLGSYHNSFSIVLTQ